MGCMSCAKSTYSICYAYNLIMCADLVSVNIKLYELGEVRMRIHFVSSEGCLSVSVSICQSSGPSRMRH